MPERVFSNFAEAKLASEIGQSDAAISLTTGAGALFPLPAVSGVGPTAQAFSLVLTDGINTEVLTCTARSGDSLTVIRGAPAYSWPAGTRALHVCAAEDLANFLQKGVSRTTDEDPSGVFEAAYFGEEILHTGTKEWWKNVSYDDPTEWRVTGLRGTIKVTISPQEAVDAGAKWAINGGTWLNSQAYSDPLGVGAFTLTFKDTTGYTTPSAVIVGVISYRTTEIVVTYPVVS